MSRRCDDQRIDLDPTVTVHVVARTATDDVSPSRGGTDLASGSLHCTEVGKVFYTFFYTAGWYSVVQQVAGRSAISVKALLSGMTWYGFGGNGAVILCS